MQGQDLKKKQQAFQFQKTDKKQKKKSIVSQKMREKRQKMKRIGQETANRSRTRLYEQNSDDQPVVIRKPKKIPPPPIYDKINYITLEQFQGSLQDERSLQAYHSAITSNSHLFANKIVLHLTTGCNCYYSIFAAEAGASKIYCVVSGNSVSEEQNVWMMTEIIRENELDQVIQVLLFKDFNAEVDVIIGEPMGFCMHYDGMLDRMIEARDLYLDKKHGLIFPNKLKFKCAFINDEHFYDKKVQFWNQVYKIPMKSMQKWIAHQPMIKIVDPSLVVSDIFKFLEFDLGKVTYEEVEEINKEFELKVFEDTPANGLSVWFEIQFNCEGQKTELKASPWQNPTKFTHVTLYNSKKLQLKANTKIKIKMYGKKYPHHGVSVMKINIADQIQSVYTFT